VFRATVELRFRIFSFFVLQKRRASPSFLAAAEGDSAFFRDRVDGSFFFVRWFEDSPGLVTGASWTSSARGIRSLVSPSPFFFRIMSLSVLQLARGGSRHRTPEGKRLPPLTPPPYKTVSFLFCEEKRWLSFPRVLVKQEYNFLGAGQAKGASELARFPFLQLEEK